MSQASRRPSSNPTSNFLGASTGIFSRVYPAGICASLVRGISLIDEGKACYPKREKEKQFISKRKNIETTSQLHFSQKGDVPKVKRKKTFKKKKNNYND